MGDLVRNGAWIATVIALALLAAIVGRYKIVAAGTGELPTAFVLDRWTGDVHSVKGPYIRRTIEPPQPNPFDKFDPVKP